MPACSDVRLTGTWTLNAGWSIWMGDLDRDGASELLAGEIRSNAAPSTRTPEERVVLLEPPLTSGRLGEAGRVLVESDPSPVPWSRSEPGMYSFAHFGDGVAWSDATGELLIGSPALGDGLDIAAFALGSTTPAPRRRRRRDRRTERRLHRREDHRRQRVVRRSSHDLGVL
jgi:hypothetical protein